MHKMIIYSISSRYAPLSKASGLEKDVKEVWETLVLIIFYFRSTQIQSALIWTSLNSTLVLTLIRVSSSILKCMIIIKSKISKGYAEWQE